MADRLLMDKTSINLGDTKPSRYECFRKNKKIISLAAGFLFILFLSIGLGLRQTTTSSITVFGNNEGKMVL